MTHQDIVFLAKHLTPCGLLFGLLIIEIINTIRGKRFYTISLIRVLTEMIIAVLKEIKGKEAIPKLNAFAFGIFLICILATLCFLIRTIFIDLNQAMIPLAVIVIFASFLYLTFKASINFLSGYH